MKCSFCKKTFVPLDPKETVCDECKETHEELSNGKGDDEDE